MKQIRGIAMLAVASVISLSSCGPSLEMTTQGVAEQITELANMRYTGFSETTLSKVNLYCTDEVADSLISDITEAYNANTYYDVTETVGSATNIQRNGISDLIETKINEADFTDFSFVVDTSKVQFRYPNYDSIELQAYDNIVEIKPENIVDSPVRFKGNSNYKLNLKDYTEYTDGTLIVELESDPSENVITNKQRIEVRLDKHGKISEINSNDFTCGLSYK